MKAQLCDARWSGNPEYGQLTLVAAFGPTMSLDLTEYISVTAATDMYPVQSKKMVGPEDATEPTSYKKNNLLILKG